MTRDEFGKFLNRARIVLQPINELISKGSTSDQQGAREQRLALWFRVLSDVDQEAADRCLDAVELEGASVIADDPKRISKHPDAWTEFARQVRTWTRRNRPVAIRSKPSGSDYDAPRHHCDACWDSNFVTVIAPAYATSPAARDKWESWSLHEIQNPPSVRCREYMDDCRRAWGEAQAYCRERGVPLTASVLCHCADSARLGPRFAPARMPIMDGNGGLALARSMVAYCKSHTMESVHAWQP